MPFFKPVIRELKKRGIEVLATARDAYQVCDVARRMGVSCIRIGHHYGKNKAAKVYGTFIRACQLWSVARRERPLLAVSHGSRSQIVVAKLMGIPTVLIGDYEHAASIPLCQPAWFIAPEVIGEPPHGFAKKRFLHYPGIKENVYATDGERTASDQLVVTVAPAPSVLNPPHSLSVTTQ